MRAILTILFLGALMSVSATAENASSADPIVMPKMRIRGDDVDMSISADPKTRRILSVVVDDVVPNSAAAKSGLVAGWKIERVNGVSITEFNIDDVDGDKLHKGQRIRFVSPRFMGIYRKVLILSFTQKPNKAQEPTT